MPAEKATTARMETAVDLVAGQAAPATVHAERTEEAATSDPTAVTPRRGVVVPALQLGSTAFDQGGKSSKEKTPAQKDAAKKIARLSSSGGSSGGVGVGGGGGGVKPSTNKENASPAVAAPKRASSGVHFAANSKEAEVPPEKVAAGVEAGGAAAGAYTTRKREEEDRHAQNMSDLRSRLMAERALLSGRKLSARTNDRALSQSEVQVKSMKYQRPEETTPLASSRGLTNKARSTVAEKKRKKKSAAEDQPSAAKMGCEVSLGECFAKLPVSDKLKKDLETTLKTEPKQFVHLVSALSMPPSSKVRASGGPKPELLWPLP